MRCVFRRVKAAVFSQFGAFGNVLSTDYSDMSTARAVHEHQQADLELVSILKVGIIIIKSLFKLEAVKSRSLACCREYTHH